MSENTQTAGTTQNTGTDATTQTGDAGEGQQQQGQQATLLSSGTQTGEGGEGTGGKPEGEASKEAPQGAPEKYEFTAPEGVVLDAAVITEFEGYAREAGMTQDAAQNFINRMAPTIAARQQAQLTEQLTKAVGEWSAASKADKEFGGAKLTESLAFGEKAHDQLGTP